MNYTDSVLTSLSLTGRSLRDLASKISRAPLDARGPLAQALHSAKGSAVETECSELYDVIHYFTI